MRIGVEATCWNHRCGYGRHLRSLLPALIETEPSDEYVVFLDGPESDLYPLPPAAKVVRVAVSRPTQKAAAADSRRCLADLWAMSRALSSARLDCLLFPTVYSYVPVATSAAKLVMIHDVIAERFPGHVFPNRAERLRWRLKSALARAQADRLITVSDYSRRGLVDHFGLSPDQVAVVGEAPDPVFRPRAASGSPKAIASLLMSAASGRTRISRGCSKPSLAWLPSRVTMIYALFLSAITRTTLFPPNTKF